MNRNMVRKILLVDDDEDDQMIFGDALRQIDPGIEYFVAKNGEEALLLLRNKLNPDTIFLDLNMPVMNGCECMAEIKKDPDLNKIPIIIYTTSSLPDDKKRSKETGAQLFLRKPNTFVILKAELEKIFSDASAFYKQP
jgi:CheY-like chemotaxis protein